MRTIFEINGELSQLEVIIQSEKSALDFRQQRVDDLKARIAEHETRYAEVAAERDALPVEDGAA